MIISDVMCANLGINLDSAKQQRPAHEAASKAGIFIIKLDLRMVLSMMVVRIRIQ